MCSYDIRSFGFKFSCTRGLSYYCESSILVSLIQTKEFVESMFVVVYLYVTKVGPIFELVAIHSDFPFLDNNYQDIFLPLYNSCFWVLVSCLHLCGYAFEGTIILVIDSWCIFKVLCGVLLLVSLVYCKLVTGNINLLILITRVCYGLVFTLFLVLFHLNANSQRVVRGSLIIWDNKKSVFL